MNIGQDSNNHPVFETDSVKCYQETVSVLLGKTSNNVMQFP